jgi:hypothetical protein
MRGVRPRYAPALDDRLNRAGSSMVAAKPSAVITPTPGTVIRRRTTVFCRAIERTFPSRRRICSRLSARARISASTTARMVGDACNSPSTISSARLANPPTRLPNRMPKVRRTPLIWFSRSQRICTNWLRACRRSGQGHGHERHLQQPGVAAVRRDRRQGEGVPREAIEGDWPYISTRLTSKSGVVVALSPLPSSLPSASKATGGARCWVWKSARPRPSRSGRSSCAGWRAEDYGV